MYRLACASIKTHIPDHFYQRVLRVQRRCCERVDVRGHQSSRAKEFFAPGKNFQKVFFLHALNTRWSTKHEDLSITSRNLLHVKYRVCRLVAGEERFYLGILVAHPSHDSTFVGAQEGPSTLVTSIGEPSIGCAVPNFSNTPAHLPKLIRRCGARF